MLLFYFRAKKPTESHSSKENYRRSEKLKAVLRKVFGILPVLRDEEVLHSSYWQLSAAMVSHHDMLLFISLSVFSGLLDGGNFSCYGSPKPASPLFIADASSRCSSIMADDF
jgi:hypothetical protein